MEIAKNAILDQDLIILLITLPVEISVKRLMVLGSRADGRITDV